VSSLLRFGFAFLDDFYSLMLLTALVEGIAAPVTIITDAAVTAGCKQVSVATLQLPMTAILHAMQQHC
jgi:hypothetical protein